MTTSTLVKSSTGNYEVGSLQVGDEQRPNLGVARFSVGDRFWSKWDKNAVCTIIKIRTSGKKPISIRWDNGRVVHCSEKFFEDMTRCSPSLTCVAAWAQDSQQQESSQEDLSCKDSVKLTNSAATDCAIASPVSESIPTCENLRLDQEQQTLSPHPRHANPSQLKENVWEALTSETVSPPSCDKSDSSSPNSLFSKTCLDCYQPPLFPETNPAHILNRCSGSFMAVGTMRNGLLSEQPSTVLSGQEKDSCLLPRPGALSKSSESSRPPGNTKSEAAAKKLGIIQKNEVYNPEWLEVQFGLPLGWTSPQEHRAATALIAPVELPSEIVSTPDWQQLPLEESCTSTVCCPSCESPLLTLADGCGVCGWLPPSQKVLEEILPHSLEKQESTSTKDSSTAVNEKVLEERKAYSLEKNPKAEEKAASHIQVVSNSSGSLYSYLKNIKLKSGHIASYPCVEDERDPDNLKHWYWGYNYKVLEDGVWKSKSKSVSRAKVSMVRRMIENNAPVAAIKAFIRVLEESPSDSLEKVLEDKQSFSLERQQASGCLYKYLKNKKLKSGAVASYPRVDGTRNPNNPDHWYWGYSYEVLEDGEWKGRSLSVPKHKVLAVMSMIDNHQPI